MTKQIFLFSIITFAIIGKIQAQDLIVTNSGDSINCKITKTTKDYVYFTFKHDTENRNTLLPTSQVSTQQKDYFPTSELPVNYTFKNIFPHFRLTIDGGWQYRTAKQAEGMNAGWQEHYRKMRSGFHYDLQAAYFFIENMGIEAMFSQQLFGNDLGYVSMTDAEGHLVNSGESSEKIAFNYTGANYLLRLFDAKKRNQWLFSVGFGYLSYEGRLFFNNAEYIKMTAGTLGSNVSIGYDIGLSESFGIGIKLSIMGGTFKDYKQTLNGLTTNETMPDKTAEGLGTIKLSVGLRFNK